MVILTEIRIQLHIFAEIVHPSHVPLKGKIKSTVFYLTGYLGPGGRFLRNCKESWIRSTDNGIQMLKEFNSFQILVITIFVGNPLPLFLSIIEIKHGCNRINTDSINMELTDPE